MLALPKITQSDLLEIEREYCSRSLSNFIKRAWHMVEPAQVYIHGWHIDAVCAHLEAVTNGDINRLLINIPPGTMKSLITGVFWPSWEWGPKNMASNRYVAASHSQDFSVRDTVKMRRLVSSEWYQNLWPTPLTRDQNEKQKFENKETGFRQAMAMKSLTGTRGDRVLIDDPHSIEGALSEADRNTTIRIFSETVPTRLNNPKKSAIIVIMQRIHEGDVSGFILNEDHGYTHLMLPMEYEPDRKCTTSIFSDPRTELNELLFEERFPRDVVERDKKLMGSFAVAGQFQQRPSPRGGSIFVTSGIQTYEDFQLPKKFDKVIHSWDCTFKDADGSDFVVGQVWGRIGADAYLLDQIRARMSFTDTAFAMIDMYNKWDSIVATLIEDKANGPAVIDTLKSKMPGLIPIEPDGSKLARAHAITSYWEAGNIKIPANKQWTQTFIDEVLGFPSTVHDDQVDAMTQAIRYLFPLRGKLNISKSTIDMIKNKSGRIL
jgi:predicted phage terminase large subunit-like protein